MLTVSHDSPHLHLRHACETVSSYLPGWQEERVSLYCIVRGVRLPGKMYLGQVLGEGRPDSLSLECWYGVSKQWGRGYYDMRKGK